MLGEAAFSGRPVAMDSGDGGVDPEVAAKERKLEQLLLGQPLSDKTRTAVLGQSNDTTAAIQAAKEFQGGGGGGRGAGAFAAGPIAGDFSLAAAARNAVPDDRQAAIMAGLMLGSPEFQRR
jgi:hypothetical protein